MDTKHVTLIRGLPGSGKTRLANEIKTEEHVVITVDDLAGDQNIGAVIRETCKALQTHKVIIDGIFVTKKVIMSIYANLCSTFASDIVEMNVIEPTNSWSNDPHKCWLKTIRRAQNTGCGMVPKTSVMDLHRNWETLDAPFSLRHRPDN